MKKLYELDASKEFGDESNATESSNISEGDGGIIAGDFEAVSGMGIGGSLEDDEAVENNLQEMLALINSKTGQDAEEFARQEAERQAYLDEEDRKVEEAKKRFNQERYEREQAALAERNERERIEREEAERLEAERQANSFFGKLSKKLKKSKKVEEEDELEYVAEEPIAENDEEVAKADDFEESEVHGTSSPSDEFFSAEEDMDLSGFISLDDKEEEPISAKEEAALEEATRGSSAYGRSTNGSYGEARSEEEALEVEQGEKRSVFSMFAKKATEKVPKPSKQARPPKTHKVVESSEPDWKFIATHDDATGLLNARAYKEDLSKQKNTLGVLFFDINGLRLVNEAHGREAGDRVVENVAKVLSNVYGKSHLYRINGGEFACIVPSPGKRFTDDCIANSGKVHNTLAKMTKEDPDKANHSVSIGYACGDGEAEVSDVAKVADYAMYQNKKAYKNAHANDVPPKSGGGGSGVAQKAPGEKAPEKDHDEMLTKEQQELKGRIKEGHSKVSRSFTANIMREIQKRAGEIEAIFIASPTFDHLFVITDIDDFLDMMEENQALIDYSYLYVVYQGGTQYYGADEYYDKVTDLFRNVADALLSGRFRSEKDVQSIPGINIFKNVYV